MGEGEHGEKNNSKANERRFYPWERGVQLAKINLTERSIYEESVAGNRGIV